MLNIIVAGSRSFANRELFANAMQLLIPALEQQHCCSATIISGCAKGPDSWVIHWAEEQGKQIIKMPANWSLGSHAGMLRNDQMAKAVHVLLAFWDGKSSGTSDMLSRAWRHQLQCYAIVSN